MEDMTGLRQLGRAPVLGCLAIVFFSALGYYAWQYLPTFPRFLFYGGLALLVVVIGKVMTPRIRAGYGHRARAARVAEPSLFAAPGELPAGRCWQCGKRVPAGAAVCGGCGATRFAPQAPTVTIPEGDDLPPGTFERSRPAEMYQPGRTDPLA